MLTGKQLKEQAARGGWKLIMFQQHRELADSGLQLGLNLCPPGEFLRFSVIKAKVQPISVYRYAWFCSVPDDVQVSFKNSTIVFTSHR